MRGFDWKLLIECVFYFKYVQISFYLSLLRMCTWNANNVPVCNVSCLFFQLKQLIVAADNCHYTIYYTLHILLSACSLNCSVVRLSFKTAILFYKSSLSCCRLKCKNTSVNHIYLTNLDRPHSLSAAITEGSLIPWFPYWPVNLHYFKWLQACVR